VVESSPSFSNSSGVAQHANSSLHFSEIATGDGSWWLVVDTDLETSWAPIDELDGPLGFDGSNGRVDVFGHNITSVEEAARHVFTVSWVAFDHLVGWLEASVGDLSDGELFMVGFLSRDDWSVGGERKVDPWVGDQVGLELGEIDVESTVEPERGGDGGDDLTDEPVEVGVGWSLDVEVPSADVVDGFVVDHESTVGVFEGGVRGQDGIVGFNDSSGNLRSWVNSKLELGFLSIVNREPLHQKRSETRTSTTTKRVEEEKSLKTSTLIGKFSDPVENQIDELFSDGVVTTSVVVGGIFFTSDQLLWMEQLPVGSGPNLVDNGWFKINENSPWHVFAGTSLREKGVEGVVTTSDSFIRRHLTVWLDAVLEAVELPAGITDLSTGLTDVNRDDFTHDKRV